MSIFDWFRKKKTPNHVLDDTDRELSLTTRRQAAQLKQARAQLELERLKMEHELEMTRMQEELDELRGDDNDDDDDDAGDSSDALLATILAKIMFGQQQQPVQVNASLPAKRAYSNEEINLLLEKIPKGARKQVASMTDEELVNYSHKFAADADDGSIMRAINIIRSWQ